jgi:hypothetical protein
MGFERTSKFEFIETIGSAPAHRGEIPAAR